MIKINIADSSAENTMKVAKICVEHPDYIGCPLKVSEIVLNGIRIMFEDYYGNSYHK